MDSYMSITGIVLLLVVLIVVPIVISYLRSIVGTFLTWRLSAAICSLYFLILLLLVLTANSLPLNGLAGQAAKADNDSGGTVSYSLQDLAQIISQGKQDDFPGIYKNSSEQTFKYSGKTLKFKPDGSDFSVRPRYYQMIVDRKEHDDGQIEAATYLTPYSIDGVEFTQTILPPRITLNNETLLIEAPHPVRSDYKHFSMDMTAKQFGKPPKSILDPSDIIEGLDVIYIRIPKSMTLDKGEMNAEIFYLDDSKTSS